MFARTYERRKNPGSEFCRGKTGMSYGITNSEMKTSISIDDDLLRSADEASRSIGVNRSQLFALAMSDFLQRRQNGEMLNQLNKVYADPLAPDEICLLKGIKIRVRPTVRESW